MSGISEKPWDELIDVDFPSIIITDKVKEAVAESSLICRGSVRISNLLFYTEDEMEEVKTVERKLPLP